MFSSGVCCLEKRRLVGHERRCACGDVPLGCAAARGWCRSRPSAASGIALAELWSAQSTAQRGWAFGRCFFLLDVLKLVIPLLDVYFCSRT